MGHQRVRALVHDWRAAPKLNPESQAGLLFLLRPQETQHCPFRFFFMSKCFSTQNDHNAGRPWRPQRRLPTPTAFRRQACYDQTIQILNSCHGQHRSTPLSNGKRPPLSRLGRLDSRLFWGNPRAHRGPAWRLWPPTRHRRLLLLFSHRPSWPYPAHERLRQQPRRLRRRLDFGAVERLSGR